MLTLEISRHIQQYAVEDCLNEWGWLKNIFILHKKKVAVYIEICNRKTEQYIHLYLHVK